MIFAGVAKQYNVLPVTLKFVTSFVEGVIRTVSLSRMKLLSLTDKIIPGETIFKAVEIVSLIQLTKYKEALWQD